MTVSSGRRAGSVDERVTEARGMAGFISRPTHSTMIPATPQKNGAAGAPVSGAPETNRTIVATNGPASAASCA